MWDALGTENKYFESGKRLLHPQQEWDAFQGQQGWLISGDEMYYVIGRIIYKDVFDTYWECAFHFCHRASGRWEPMDETHNYEKKLKKAPS